MPFLSISLLVHHVVDSCSPRGKVAWIWRIGTAPPELAHAKPRRKACVFRENSRIAFLLWIRERARLMPPSFLPIVLTCCELGKVAILGRRC